MLCPHCQSKTKVIDSGSIGDLVLRTRLCLNPACGYQFGTEEHREPALTRFAREYRRILCPPEKARP